MMADKPEKDIQTPALSKQTAAWMSILKVFIVPVVLLLVVIYLPFFLQRHEQYHMMHILPLIGIYILLAIGLNVIMGYTGILNLGYATFYGIGAYAAALLAIKFSLSFWVLIPMCGLVAMLTGVLLGMPTLRLRGDYIAIVTLGFVEIVRLGLNNMDSLTNGPKGLPRIGEKILTPQISLGSFTWKMDDDIDYYFFILALVLLTIFVMGRLHNSRIGRNWVSIREDEIASELMGVNTTMMKIYAFGVGSFFAGVAGCIYTHWIGFITHELFTFWESVLIVCMVVLGGMGNIWGVILGTVLIVGIPEILRDVLQSISDNLSNASAVKWQKVIENLNLGRMLIFGFLMIIMVIFRSQGIIPAKRPKVNLKQLLSSVSRRSGGDSDE
ncbi:MAG: branched-chain amino acid ABC transporter permease [bacterium]